MDLSITLTDDEAEAVDVEVQKLIGRDPNLTASALLERMIVKQIRAWQSVQTQGSKRTCMVTLEQALEKVPYSDRAAFVAKVAEDADNLVKGK